MTIKQRAMLETFFIAVSIVLISVGINYILQYVPQVILLYLLGLVIVSIFVYMIYGVVLSRLEYHEKLKDFADKV